MSGFYLFIVCVVFILFGSHTVVVVTLYYQSYCRQNMRSSNTLVFDIYMYLWRNPMFDCYIQLEGAKFKC